MARPVDIRKIINANMSYYMNFYGLEPKDVAQIMGVSASTISRRMGLKDDGATSEIRNQVQMHRRRSRNAERRAGMNPLLNGTAWGELETKEKEVQIPEFMLSDYKTYSLVVPCSAYQAQGKGRVKRQVRAE